MQQPLAKKSRHSASYHQGSLTSGSFGDSTPPASESYAGSGLAVGLPALSPGQLTQTLQPRLRAFIGNEALLSRSWAHLVVLLLAVLAISLNNTQWLVSGSRVIRPLKRLIAQPVATPVTTAEQGVPLTLSGQLNNIQDELLIQAAVPRTIIPDRSREEISTYLVQAGDTIGGIALKFGIAPETVLWTNDSLKNPHFLQIGQELTILPVDGVYHQVGGDDTIEGIASTYEADPADIINYPLNGLDPENLTITPGQWLVVPGGSKPFVPTAVTSYTGPIPADAAAGSGIFDWPASGTIYNGYSSWHPAIDIANYLGAPALAADAGFVVAAYWDYGGYGNAVVIDHGNGFQTLYAHLQTYYVQAGDNVVKGQQIGEVGITGNATGPHLHFEVRQGTIQLNPLGFLP